MNKAVPDISQTKTSSELRTHLNISQKEAVASATMTGIFDNFIYAFAIFLNASAGQLGLLTGLPQIVGALFQLLSVWAGFYLKRLAMIVTGATFQAIATGGIACLALIKLDFSVWILIALAAIYHAASHFIQPQWRSLMGELVPARIRGRYFAHRTRITMTAALIAFMCGGYLLNQFQTYDISSLGFFFLFMLAMAGRFSSAYLLKKHPSLESDSSFETITAFSRTWSQLKSAMAEKTFREFTLFVALMNGAVAISAPFFAVYMLRDLSFSYLEFTFNIGASILMQCVMLGSWGKISDQYGNKLVMLITGGMIPFLPLLWLFSTNYFYLLLLQFLSGFLWSGFSLSTANFLYDLRPHRTHFSTYSAVNACLIALAVFIGSLAGGALASAELSTELLGSVLHRENTSPILWVFIFSSSLRILVLLWYWPKAREMRVQRRPELRELVFRIARFTPVSGLGLDSMNVTEKKGFSSEIKNNTRKNERH